MSIVEHMQALGFLPVRRPLRMTVSRTITRAISGADSIHKGRHEKRRRYVLSSPISSLCHSTVITFLNFLSFLLHRTVSSLSIAIAGPVSCRPSSSLLGILWPCVYFSFTSSLFWVSSNFRSPPLPAFNVDHLSPALIPKDPSEAF